VENLKNELLEVAREVLQKESEAIKQLCKEKKDIVKAAELILATEGQVITSGMGKSGFIARKMAATLSSVGVPATYLHPSEALHGDVGVITSKDTLILYSKSGRTSEVVQVLQLARRLGVGVVGITAEPLSPLAQNSDVFINIRVKEEAPPLFVAPTVSTTAMLAVSDAIAMVTVKERNFTKRDFAKLHPGGALGKMMLVDVASLMVTGDGIPRVTPDASFADLLVEMSVKSLGCAIVFEDLKDMKSMIGIVTDGDLRRFVVKHDDPFKFMVKDIMTRNPKVIKSTALADEALRIMEDNKITVVPVLDEKGLVVGVLHMHHILQAKLV